jgi:hypothetical protein
MNSTALLTLCLLYVNLSLSMICMIQIRQDGGDTEGASREKRELNDNQTKLVRVIGYNFTGSSSAADRKQSPVGGDTSFVVRACD